MPAAGLCRVPRAPRLLARARGKVSGLFNPNIGSARSVVLLPGGQAVLAGSVVNDFAAVQLTVQGTLDGSFAIHATAAGTKSDIAHGLVLQADPRGSTVRAIQAGEASGSNYDFSVIRLWL